MFMSHIQLQIVSGLVLGVMLFLFPCSRKLKLHSSRIYSVFLAIAFANILSDIATVYTITHMDTVSAFVNRMAHAAFYLTLEGMAYCLFLYVLTLSHRRHRLPAMVRVALALPFVLAALMAVFAKVYYYNDGVSVYSYGPAVNVLFGCLVYYIFASNFTVLLHRRVIARSTRLSIYAAMVIWIAALYIQHNHPELLISNVAVMLMALYSFFALENPRELLDGETGCFSRRAMVLAIDEMLARREKKCIVNISVENLRELSHGRGYSATAAALKEMSEYVQALFEAELFRYHSSAFMLMTPLGGEELMQRCEKLAERLKHPFCEDKRISLKAQIDVLEKDISDETCHEILETLDFLLEHDSEKEEERGICIIGEKQLAVRKRSELVQALLQTAIREDGFRVVYQPIYHTDTKSFASAEALVRMKDTQTIGFVPPDEFIVAAERCGCIAKLGEIVLEKVCALCAEQKLWEKGVSYIEVNLSGVQASDPELPDAILRTLHRYGVEPSFLNFEITETAAVDSGEALMNNMRRLRELGCSFSMDDFGTGYSNLSQIADTAYDLVKLDKSLIWPCFEENGENANIILHSVVDMVNALRSGIVAEGVETEEQAKALEAMGVTHLQGYYFCRPVPDTEYIDFLGRSAPNPAH